MSERHPDFVYAEQQLRDALAAEHQRIGQRRGLNVSFSDDVAKRSRLYVAALKLVDGARPELLRRAMVLHSMTADGSEFADAWEGVQGIVERLRILGAGNLEVKQKWYQDADAADSQSETNSEQIPHVVASHHWTDDFRADELVGFEPLSVQHVENLIDKATGLRDHWASMSRLIAEQTNGNDALAPLDDAEQAALQRLIDAAQGIVDAAELAHHDGCQALLLFGTNLSGAGEDAEFQPFLDSLRDPESTRRIIETPWTPKQMLDAVDGMTRWSDSRSTSPPSKPTDDGESGETRGENRKKSNRLPPSADIATLAEIASVMRDEDMTFRAACLREVDNDNNEYERLKKVTQNHRHVWQSLKFGEK